MNKKAEGMDGLGVVLVAFIAALVGLVIFASAIVPIVGQVTNTATITNASFTAPAIGSESNIGGKAVSSFVAYNATGLPTASGFNGTAHIGDGNYTIADNQLVNGDLTATYNTSLAGYVGALNVSYISQPVSYISDAGGRALAGLIAVFAALAIMITALSPTFRSGVMDMFGK